MLSCRDFIGRAKETACDVNLHKACGRTYGIFRTPWPNRKLDASSYLAAFFEK
jgi:hypothetical protein